MPVLMLSNAFITHKMQCPPGLKRIEFCDKEVPGLLIECRSADGSTPTWYWRRKVNGKLSAQRLGSLAELDLDTARKQARLLKAQHALAPKVEPVQPDRLTLDAFFHDHYLPHAKMHKRSWLRDIQLFARIGPKFGHLTLKEISRHHVQVFQSELVDEGLARSTANHHVQLMRHLCSLAVSWDMLERNVLKGVPLFILDNQVENYLSDEEVDRLVEVCRVEEDQNTAMVVLFLLSTGARLREGLKAEWAQVDEVAKVWRIPASNSKSKRMRSIPLNEGAMWVLRQLASRGQSVYLFPSPVTGKPFVTITRAWYRLRRQAGLNDRVRIHDLRHTFASRLVANGRSLYEVQTLLSHADPKTTMRYAHLSSKVMLEAANAASVKLPKPEPTVVNAGH